MIIQIQKSEGAGTPPGFDVAGGGFCGVVLFSERLKVPTGLGSLITGATALTCQKYGFENSSLSLYSKPVVVVVVLTTIFVNAASVARTISYCVASLIGDQLKLMGGRQLLHTPFSGASSVGPVYAEVTMKPGLTEKYMGGDQGLCMGMSFQDLEPRTLQ